MNKLTTSDEEFYEADESFIDMQEDILREHESDILQNERDKMTYILRNGKVRADSAS